MDSRPSSYTIIYSVPYEGETSVDLSTLEDVKTWIHNNQRSFDWNYDNLTVFEIKREVNVYELMKEG